MPEIISLKVKVESPVILGKIELPDSSTRPIKIKRTIKNYIISGDKCCYCERPFDAKIKGTKEHLVPKSKGGGDSLINIRPCCIECNSLRSNYPIRDFKKVIKLIKRVMDGNFTYKVEDIDNILKNLKTICNTKIN